MPLEQLIGTETCTYCAALTECLSLPPDGESERVACQGCVTAAFDRYWNASEAERSNELEAENMRLRLGAARLKVKPIVDSERQGEQIGDLMDLRLD